MPKLNSSTYPDPLVISPLLSPHKYSFILLHGRGSNGPKFGADLLSTHVPLAFPLPDSTSKSTSAPIPAKHMPTLRDLFPHAKFIFPTASTRRATIYKRSIIHQWFDNWHLSDPDMRTELMSEGLRESSAFIRNLVREEASKVGGKNVVLGGLSQGCATVLVTMMLGLGGGEGNEDKKSHEEAEVALGGVTGMCGWLPFAKAMEELARGRDIYDTDDLHSDPFDRSDSRDDNDDDHGAEPKAYSEVDTQVDVQVDLGSPIAKALSYLRSEIDLTPSISPSSFSPLFNNHPIPFFLGHGVLDNKVPISLGRGAASCLSAMNVDVEWREYEGLGHWYSEEMLGDLVIFLREKVGWEIALDAQGEQGNTE